MNISIYLRRCGAAAALLALTVPSYAGDENETPMGDPNPAEKAEAEGQKPGAKKPGKDGKAGKRGDRRGPQSKLFTAMDTDKDTNLSTDELKNSSAALLTLDKNKDGQLTADEFGRERGARGGRNPLSRLDKDGDGKISKDEAPERMKQRFDDMDTNADGFIDAEEQAAMLERMRGGRGGPGGRGGAGGPDGAPGQDGTPGEGGDPKAEGAPKGEGRGARGGRGGDRGRRGRGRGGDPVVVALDTDKNGSLSADEIKNAPVALMALDKNKDGKVAMMEVVAAGRRAAVAGMMARLDKDGDGKVSIEEAPDRMLENWDRFDEDGDGFITVDEMSSMGGRRQGDRKKNK